MSCLETTGEDGPWSMSLLTAYIVNKTKNLTLEAYLDRNVFEGTVNTDLAFALPTSKALRPLIPDIGLDCSFMNFSLL